VISVLDRESGAQERITSKGYQFEALFTSSDFKVPNFETHVNKA